MPTFTPPTVNDVRQTINLPPGASQEMRWANDLKRHFANGPRGINVYKKTDGTYTETQPAWADIDITYLGGHVHTVTTAEGNALTAAGYTVV